MVQTRLLVTCIFLLSGWVTALAGNPIRLEKLSDSTYSVRYRDCGNILIRTGFEFANDGKQADCEVRLLESAVALRYVCKEPMEVKSELTEWTMPEGTEVWYFERNNFWKLKSYAGVWKSCDISELHKVSSQGPVQGLPLVFRFPNGKYGFLTEVALHDFSGMRAKSFPGNRIGVNFTEKDGFRAGTASPWRLLYFADNLNDLVNCTAIKELSPEPDPEIYEDISYVRPGKCVWRWFAKGTGTPAEEKEMIDAAAELGFSYSMIDDGWIRWKNRWEEVRRLSGYAVSKNVRLILWKDSKDIADASDDYADMRSWLDTVANTGVAGIKVDFINSESAPKVDFETTLLKEAARRKLQVVFHGCHKPTGEQYTYPNELTREAVRGLELNKMKEDGFVSAAHNAALPFTRCLVGNTDYTPLSFVVPGNTSFAHQIATFICFRSDLQVLAEDPYVFLENEEFRPVCNFLREVPATWDEIRVLDPSEIGKLAVIARRSGNDWYIGILNGEDKEKSFVIDLKDLGLRGRCHIGSFTDDMAAEKVLLPENDHRPARMERFPAVPFRYGTQNVKVGKYEIQLAPDGGAVLVVRSK